MSELGLLGLLVPKELGGLGQSHRCAAMVVETLARYGCPSTAMVYSESLPYYRLFYRDLQNLESAKVNKIELDIRLEGFDCAASIGVRISVTYFKTEIFNSKNLASPSD